MEAQLLHLADDDTCLLFTCDGLLLTSNSIHVKMKQHHIRHVCFSSCSLIEPFVWSADILITSKEFKFCLDDQDCIIICSKTARLLGELVRLLTREREREQPVSFQGNNETIK